MTPQQQPLIQSNDVKYLGTVTLPGGMLPNALAVDGDLMYVGIYLPNPSPIRTGPAVVKLPSSGLGNATLVQAFTPLPNLNKVHRGGTYTDIINGGILPWQGKLITSGWTYYDGSGGQIRSHWTGTSTSQNGPYAMQVTDIPLNYDGTGRMSMVGGYMGIIPPEWRSLFGFTGLTGQCCIPIISRSSYGPSVSAFDPLQVGIIEPIPARMLIGYPDEHKTLGVWDAKPPGTYYGGTDQLGSVGFPSNTRSVLFTGRHGDQFCYGPGTGDINLVGTPGPGAYPYCYDPYDPNQGNHGPPYRPTMWAYDANDLLLVKNGTKKPWEVFPYAKWTLPGLLINQPYYLRAGWYDDIKRRYYVGDTSSPIIHVFEIGLGGLPPTPINCDGTWSTWTRVVGSESTCIDKKRNYQERRDFTIITPASGGGTACPVSPEFRTLTEDCEPPSNTKTSVELTVTKVNATGGTVSIPLGTVFTLQVK
jgi:hypothetical protein